jgi:hypothetical protein
MFDIKFYGNNGESPVTIELSRDFYQKLLQSDFTEIGTSHEKIVEIDGEKEEIEAIDLNKGKIPNRQRLIDFFKEEIVEESIKMLEKLGDSPSKEEYKEQTYPLRKLQEILKYLENTQYSYLQRVT